jgi:hypothetical protein
MNRPLTDAAIRRRRYGTPDAIGGWRCGQYDGIVAWAACERFGRG